MDTVTLARAFFGSSLAFHIIFATLGVGLSLMIFISEILYHWKKDSDYAIMAKRWTKAFAILLGVAIPTGTIIGVQISLLWPGFAKIVGQVISVPFQIEIQIVASGTPEQVVKEERSYTGEYLKEILNRDKARMKERIKEVELSQ